MEKRKTPAERYDVSQYLPFWGELADVLRVCAEARSLATVLMDCTTLSYCMPGSDALIIAQPGSGLDRQPLSRLLDSAGRIQVPLDTHGSGTQPCERGFQLAFAPKVAEDAGLQFAGDTFQFTALNAMAEGVAGSGEQRHGALKDELTRYLLAELRAHGCPLPEGRALEIWEADLELDAQGLAVWLDSREPA